MENMINQDKFLDLAAQWLDVQKHIELSERAAYEDPDDDIWLEILTDDYALREHLERELDSDPEWSEWLGSQIKARLMLRDRTRLADLIAAGLEHLI